MIESLQRTDNVELWGEGRDRVTSFLLREVKNSKSRRKVKESRMKKGKSLREDKCVATWIIDGVGQGIGP